jgi:hypothetical protein
VGRNCTLFYEFADIFSGHGILDVREFLRVKPDTVFTTAEYGCGKSALGNEITHLLSPL